MNIKSLLLFYVSLSGPIPGETGYGLATKSELDLIIHESNDSMDSIPYQVLNKRTGQGWRLGMTWGEKEVKWITG